MKACACEWCDGKASSRQFEFCKRHHAKLVELHGPKVLSNRPRDPIVFAKRIQDLIASLAAAEGQPPPSDEPLV